VQVAVSLRQEGWTEDVILIGDESALPYHRPPLSKAYLSGKSSFEELALRSAEFYAKQRIDLLDSTVTSVDRDGRRLVLATGETLAYNKLAVCTGARPRQLAIPGTGLAGVFYLRTAVDVELIRKAAIAGGRVVIVGGGYIGLETAASLRQLGLDVTVIEAAERVLERVTAPEVSDFFTRMHRREGVDVRTGASVEAIVGDGHVREVVMSDGESLLADLVIVGIGVEPNVELAADAGLYVDDGVVIDDHAQTSDPDIVAAGDCATHEMGRYGRRIRLESVPSAGEQAKVAAATIAGKPKTITALPWFWSHQFDLKLQIAGLNTGYDEVVLNGNPTRDEDFTCYYLRSDELIAADCINRPRDFMFSKQVITQKRSVDRAELAATVTA
jgi:3-phenylpropionate/trans-cinnamate dioxygenase ferredoxin reductase subunit